MKKFIAILLTACFYLSLECNDVEAYTSTINKDAVTPPVEVEIETEDNVITTDAILGTSDYDIDDYVILNDYRNMEITLENDYSIPEENIKEKITSILKDYPIYTTDTEDKEVSHGDIVVFRYVGRVGNIYLDKISGLQRLKIGSDFFIEGIEQAMIGHKVGETIISKHDLSKDYSNKRIAGRTAGLKIEIISIEKEEFLTYETMTDEKLAIALEGQEVTTTAELKELVERNLASDSLAQKTKELQDVIMKKLIEECEVRFPEGIIDKKIKQTKNIINFQKEDSEMSFEEYTGMTEDSFKDYVKEVTAKELILEALIKDMDITITESELETFIFECVSKYGYESKDKFIENYGGETAVLLSYAENVALSRLVAMYI